MKSSVQALYKVIEDVLKTIKIPASSIVNQLPGRTLPPGGNTGQGYTPDPDAVTRVSVRKNSTGSVYSRRRLNLIEGMGTTLTVADDSVNEEIDVTIAVSAGGGVAPDDAKYVTTAAHANLTAELVIPGLAGSADRAGSGTIAEEYDTGSTGLTWNTTAPTNDSNSTIPSHLYVNPASNTLYYAVRAYAPAGAFDARAKVGVGAGNGAQAYIGLHIQDNTNTNIVTILLDFNAGLCTLEAYTSTSGSGGYSLAASKQTYAVAPYLRITRDGSNNWQIMYSFDGLGWYVLATVGSFAVTVSHIGYYIQSATNNAGQSMYSDWLRAS